MNAAQAIGIHHASDLAKLSYGLPKIRPFETHAEILLALLISGAHIVFLKAIYFIGGYMISISGSLYKQIPYPTHFNAIFLRMKGEPTN